MEQRSLLIITFFAVVMIFGGLIAYDTISNNRLNKTGNDNRSNWNWTDNWTTNKTPVEPQVEPNDPTPEVHPKQQIVAKNYQDAVKKSGELGMPILVLFEADWCGWCKKMKQETLPNANVKEALENYIIVAVNTDNNKEVVKKHKVRGLPSQLITNYREENLKFSSGYKDADSFIKWLNNSNLYKQPKASEK